jgi:hypothetical protein
MEEEEAVTSATKSKKLSAKLTPTLFLHKFLAQSLLLMALQLLM